jgi:hypothetical protein
MTTPTASGAHTPTPWEQIGTKVFRQHDRLLFTADCSLPEANYETNHANAAFIVEACNSYNALKAEVSALSARCAEMEKYSERLETLAKAFRQMFVKQSRSPYVLNCMTESYLYDDAECDGACLLDDIDSALASQESKT